MNECVLNAWVNTAFRTRDRDTTGTSSLRPIENYAHSVLGLHFSEGAFLRSQERGQSSLHQMRYVRLKCTKFIFGRGLASDPAERTYIGRYADPLVSRRREISRYPIPIPHSIHSTSAAPRPLCPPWKIPCWRSYRCCILQFMRMQHLTV